jgi:hypothetical protein
MNLCQYKDIFGKPRKGVHAYRLLDIAMVDLIATIISAILVAKWIEYDFITVFLFLMILSVFVHKLFCVETTLTKLIFR